MTIVNEYKPEHAMESVIKPYPYQVRFVTNKARFMIVMWSRQCGKSMGAALLVNDDILMAEAEGKKTLWTVISRSLSQAREMAIKIRDVARAVEAAKKILIAPSLREVVNELEERSFELEYPGGSRVVVVSGNPDSAAGFTGNVLWDEAALTKRNRELFTTAFPVVSRGGYKFIIITTPRPGWFQKKWEEALKPDSIWSTDKLTIHEAVAQGCPQDPVMLKAALNDDIAWRQEYLCEFVDDEICWLPWELIQGCTSDKASKRLIDSDDDSIYAGWDIARWHHLSVLTLLAKRGNRFTTVGMVEMKRMPFEQQYDAVTAACKHYPKFTRLVLDAGGMGEPIVETMKKRLGGKVEGVKFQGLKEILAGDLRGLFEERNILIPDDHDLRQDLHSVRCTTTAAGNKRFEGEAGESHADRFWSVAMAVHAGITKMLPKPVCEFVSKSKVAGGLGLL